MLVIQPVLLCSVLRRFVHATGCGKHLFVIIIIINNNNNIIIIIIIGFGVGQSASPRVS